MLRPFCDNWPNVSSNGMINIELSRRTDRHRYVLKPILSAFQNTLKFLQIFDQPLLKIQNTDKNNIGFIKTVHRFYGFVGFSKEMVSLVFCQSQMSLHIWSIYEGFIFFQFFFFLIPKYVGRYRFFRFRELSKMLPMLININHPV